MLVAGCNLERETALVVGVVGGASRLLLLLVPKNVVLAPFYTQSDRRAPQRGKIESRLCLLLPKHLHHIGDMAGDCPVGDYKLVVFVMQMPWNGGGLGSKSKGVEAAETQNGNGLERGKEINR